MAIHSIDIELAPGRVITIETGKMAALAHGACTVQQGETIVFTAACSADPRPGLDFFPLQVDYREKFSAAGRIPGGYFKREGRPSEKEILTSRMTDRPCRPLFPEGYIDDVQIQSLLLSADGENDADVLSMLAASVVLTLSPMPFNGPIGALRVGRVNGEFVANPTHSEMAESDLDLVYAGLADKVIMIEGGGDEVSEEILRDALRFANEMVKKQIAAQLELALRAGKKKVEPKLHLPSEQVVAAVREASAGKLDAPCKISSKEERYAALGVVQEEVTAVVLAKVEGDADDLKTQIKTAFKAETEKTIRRHILDEQLRSDGRSVDQLRPLSAEVGLLPRTHGSGLFSRGETQVLVITTLGSDREVQSSDAITGGQDEKKFMLHYNFPNFSVGETGRIMGPGRREIGHGALAERSLERMMPKDYPYVVRCVSEVMASNGSTSMGSVCAASLALMDAGVPLKKAVAGISCGLVQDGERSILLTDILGSEDHYGDMDFKVSGTRDGITGFQLDLKIAGVSVDLLYDAMLRNKDARMKILDVMDMCIAVPRDELSPYAPRVHVMQIDTEKIGALIGPGGKVIRGITDKHDVQISVEDDGTVKIYANDKVKMDGAIRDVDSVTAEVKIGKIYRGEVKTVKDFGAFVEVLPGQDGLLHISEMADYRVSKVEDICNVGDMVTVKVIDVDDRGRIRLSRKEALADMEALTPES